MLLAAERQDGVEAGEMTEALTTVAWGLKQVGRASGGIASISRALISSACNKAISIKLNTIKIELYQVYRKQSHEISLMVAGKWHALKCFSNGTPIEKGYFFVAAIMYFEQVLH